MKPYQPNNLPLEDLDYRLLFGLVGDANAELARYEFSFPRSCVGMHTELS
jgi:hypothetical protein